MKTKPKTGRGAGRSLPPLQITLSLLLLAALGGATRTLAQGSAAAGPDYNAPWPGAAQKAVRQVAPQAASAAAPVTPQVPASATAATPAGVLPAGSPVAPPVLKPPKATKHEIGFSGDFMLGQGTVTLPLGYSLDKTLGAQANVPVSAISADRSSVYFGGTLTYSYGQAWYVDLSFIHGSSSGSQSIDADWLGNLPSDFKITDDWMQVYLRYTFPRLRGKRLSAYMRVGASFVQSELTTDTESMAVAPRYSQEDTTEDMLGNLGFGLGYSLYTSRRARLGLQFEGEGFYGTRTQDSLEELSADEGLVFERATIDNNVYGGIGRLTLRYEYRLGKSGLFKIFGDVGGQMRYTLVEYPGTSAPSEMLWGPYVKLGLRYAF